MKPRTWLAIAEHASFVLAMCLIVLREVPMATYMMASCAVFHLWKLEEPK